ncbi:MAG: dienelactone hydrolase family protein [Planctomycetaceae bacterium]|jgi:predicted peptidase|nr:dienelactone hydrolase family protein [Planctomycetaceae bacterium]
MSQKISRLALLFACFAFTAFAQNDNPVQTGKPEPGKLVLQTVELPKSTCVWNNHDVSQLGIPKAVDKTQTESVLYWLFLPKDYDGVKMVPLLLFLHGAGERGVDGGAVKVHGPTKLLTNNTTAESWKFLTVAPQCKPNYYWSPEQLFLLLDDIEKNYKVDKRRVYVTGLSMGGFATWMMLNENVSRITAAVPICGGGDPAWAGKMLETPIQVFHGDKDGAVNIDMSRKMIEAIEKLGGKKITFTVYPGVGHDAWTQTYDKPELYEWMLKQSL